MTLEVGDKAPSFNLPTDGGGTISLKDLKGETVILYFYPRTIRQAARRRPAPFATRFPDFSKAKAKVIGISKDPVKKHDKFKEKYELTFPLASDEDGAVCADYGTWVEKSMYGRKYMGIDRSTFLIDGKGVIRAIWRKVKVPGHVDEVLKAAQEL
ncbi:alkyl hydroperoxide reductase [Methyloceanibacter stevinii]|uniref:thioredoxin-dependent peroxiredoxin n=1 Tax=Methyloceanibacter stevinii TaxID=1774970 RepID=A0A1E3VQ03_9HYPH|nr:peroxiredoxin [Methyloceanibacter stevinii]ODR95592.1 alkyl hydroperoxide reductase [Methyloceanibacter stevinii]